MKNIFNYNNMNIKSRERASVRFDFIIDPQLTKYYNKNRNDQHLYLYRIDRCGPQIEESLQTLKNVAEYSCKTGWQ